MCGIAGFYNLKNSNFKVDKNLLDLMQKKIEHRGPDGVGFFIDEQNEIALVHRRLSIIDLSDSANQPMQDFQKSVVIVFNGEIYNYQALKKELEIDDFSYFSSSDTEVLIYAYKKWGIDFVHKIEGMFAIALFDFEKKEFYLIRDRIGVKPVYFSMQENILSFASEIKAILALPWINKEFSNKAFYHYLTFMVTPAPYTIYKNIYKLPAGYYLKIDANKNLNFVEWYNPIKLLSNSEKKEIQSEAYCLEKIEFLIKESVKKRMVSDVPVAAFLSGGVDSSLNVALMTEINPNLKTFTVAFSDGPETNEFFWADQIAKKFKTEHHKIVISEKEAFDFYEKMVYHLDEPLADCVCIPFYYVAKLARDAGIKVAQVGEGADELFFGYQTYANYKKFYDRYWQKSDKIVPDCLKKFLYKISKKSFSKNLNHLEILRNWANKRSLFWGGAIAFNESQKDFILNGFDKNDSEQDFIVTKILGQDFTYDSHSIVKYYLDKLQNIDPDADFLKQIMFLELKQRLPELLLMRADKMSMATGVEAREPFLDHYLVEFMLNVPANLKFKNGQTKYLLKRIAEKYLPKDIIYRKKIGFAAPTDRWFDNGKYFSLYFAKKSKYNILNVNLQNLYKNSRSSFAVQNWTLQNFFAARDLD